MWTLQIIFKPVGDMLVNGYLYFSLLLILDHGSIKSGCLKQSTVKKHLCVPAICGSLQPDNRTQPGEMNDNPGTNLNIFPTLTMPQSGIVTAIDYFPVKTGGVFVSFWSSTGHDSFNFTMVEAIRIKVNDPTKTKKVS